MSDSFVWNLWGYVNVSALHQPPQPYALLALNHPIHNSAVFRSLWTHASFRAAADGGANRLAHIHDSLDPPWLHAIVGDLDSLTDDTRQLFERQGQPLDIYRCTDENATDFAKAVYYIRDKIDKPNSPIVVLGGLGGRIDQGLSVVHHLYLLQKERRHRQSLILIGNGGVTVLLSPGIHDLRVRPNPQTDSVSDILQHLYVGIIPIKHKAIISTKGLQWDVETWETEVGGQVSTNNWVADGVEHVWVETDAEVLFTVNLYDDGQYEV